VFSVKQLKGKITLMTRFTTGHDHVIKAKFNPGHIITIEFLVKFRDFSVYRAATFQVTSQIIHNTCFAHQRCRQKIKTLFVVE